MSGQLQPKVPRRSRRRPAAPAPEPAPSALPAPEADQRIDDVMQLVDRVILDGAGLDRLRADILGHLNFDDWTAKSVRAVMLSLLQHAPTEDRDWMAEVARDELAFLAKYDAERAASAQPGISESDRGLIYLVSDICRTHHNSDFVGEVFAELGAAARVQLNEILERLTDLDVKPLKPRSVKEHYDYHSARHAIADELHAWAHRWNAPRSLVDAWLLDHETWDKVHVTPLAVAPPGYDPRSEYPNAPAPAPAPAPPAAAAPVQSTPTPALTPASAECPSDRDVKPESVLLAPGSEERKLVLEAVGALNRALDRLYDCDNPMAADPYGEDHLLRARGELMRALAAPDSRKKELDEAIKYLRAARGDSSDSEVRRTTEAYLLEQRWASSDDVPGTFYVETPDIDRLGIDPALDVKL